MSRVILYPYKMGSASRKALSDALKEHGKSVLSVYPDKSYKPKDSDFIINWGNSTTPTWGMPDLNHPDNVELAIDKLKTYHRLKESGVLTPDRVSKEYFTQIFGHGHSILLVARTKLKSYGGDGLIIFNSDEEWPEASLYQYYINKTHEFRVHVFMGEVLDVQEKRKRNGTGGRESAHIWNHENDFVFCRENLNAPAEVLQEATLAVEALGLSFGAVDVGYVDQDGSSYPVVFEVNTAPGLTGTTLDKYVEKISSYL